MSYEHLELSNDKIDENEKVLIILSFTLLYKWLGLKELFPLVYGVELHHTAKKLIPSYIMSWVWLGDITYECSTTIPLRT